MEVLERFVQVDAVGQGELECDRDEEDEEGDDDGLQRRPFCPRQLGDGEMHARCGRSALTVMMRTVLSALAETTTSAAGLKRIAVGGKSCAWSTLSKGWPSAEPSRLRTHIQ